MEVLTKIPPTEVIETRKGKIICTALEKIWLTINEVVADITKKGVVPAHQVMIAIQGAKVLINLCKFHPNVAHDINPQTLDAVQGFCVTCCGADIVARIECELRKVEDLIVIEAFTKVGEQYALQMQNRIRVSWDEVMKAQQVP